MSGGQIRIRQDFNGCWGLYLFRSGDYFALSNSFFRLEEYLRTRFPLTLNRDYANHLLLSSPCSHSYAETAVEEIQLIDKDAVVIIDTKTAKLRTEFTNYAEESIALDTPEGMATLDRWFDKWTTLFRNLREQTDNISTNLSGGFDSRITFLLMLCAGVDLNGIEVRSIHDNLHTHAEDYEIASEIAAYYGFKLNNHAFDEQAYHYSLKDSLNISFYAKLATHKQMFYKTAKFVKTRYVVTGAGGEALRAHWNQSAEDFLSVQAGRARRYSRHLAQEIGDSTVRLHQAAFRAVDEKFSAAEKEPTKYPMRLYRLTRCRHHFGKEALERLLCNEFVLTPLLDPDIRSLKLDTADCRDGNLLMALIYVRYCPSLLNFRFEGRRSICPETIAYAQKINEAFPHAVVSPAEKVCSSFQVITEDAKVLDVLRGGQDNPGLPAKTPERYMKAVFDSCSFRKLFATCFDEELYEFAAQYAVEKDFQPMQECHAVIGVTKVIADVLVSRQICRPTLTQGLDRFIEEDVYEPENLSSLVNRFKDDLTARVDIKLMGERADFAVAWISDNWAKVTQPKWLQQDGCGYVVEGYHGALDLRLDIRTGGELMFAFRGKYVRDEQGKQLAYWVEYQNVLCNGEEQFQGTKSVWHNKPFRFSRTVNAGDTVTLHLEWTPCRYSTEEADQLKKRLSARENQLSVQEKQLSAQEKQLSTQKKQLSALKQENAALQKKNKAQEKKLNKLRNSYAYRIGRVFTWPVRKVRTLLKRLRK